MKTAVFLLFTFGVWVVGVVTCAPRHNPGPMPLQFSPCNLTCPDYYRPVCAVNALGIGRTFNNRCFLDKAYCTERTYYAPLKEGEC